MHQLGYYLGIHPWGAIATVVATALLYFSFAWVLRLRGQRIFSSPSSLDLAVVSVIGAIVGRATMGRNPTLVGGAIALATLLLCEHLAGRVRRAVGDESRRHRAVAVVVDGQVDHEALRSLGVDETALWSALRTSGVGSADDAALVVLEPHGQFSVLRAGTLIDDGALTGVRGADDVRRRWAAAGGQERNDTSG